MNYKEYAKQWLDRITISTDRYGTFFTLDDEETLDLDDVVEALLNDLVPKLMEDLKLMVNHQAQDEGLWFIAETAPEGYLQSKLRELHGLIESM